MSTDRMALINSCHGVPHSRPVPSMAISRLPHLVRPTHYYGSKVLWSPNKLEISSYQIAKVGL